MVAGTSHESSINSFQQRRNGRGAYFALCQHNLGRSKWEKVIEDAESYMMKREWNGRNQRFTLLSHINKHREAYTEMSRASQFTSYELPNEHTRTGRLLKSLTSKDAAIISAITHIQGNIQFRNDFGKAADFILLTAPTTQTSNQRISSTRTNNRSRQRGNKNNQVNPVKGPKTGVEVRYYSKKEWNKLSPADQRDEVVQLRKQQLNQNSDNTHDIAALQQHIQALEERLIAATTTTPAPSRNPLSNPLTQRGTDSQN